MIEMRRFLQDRQYKSSYVVFLSANYRIETMRNYLPSDSSASFYRANVTLTNKRRRRSDGHSLNNLTIMTYVSQSRSSYPQQSDWSKSTYSICCFQLSDERKKRRRVITCTMTKHNVNKRENRRSLLTTFDQLV